jgi:hypothetical protein
MVTMVRADPFYLQLVLHYPDPWATIRGPLGAKRHTRRLNSKFYQHIPPSIGSLVAGFGRL